MMNKLSYPLPDKLLDKQLAKISNSTIGKFGGRDNVSSFLQALSESGNVICAGKKVAFISPIYLYRLINGDKALKKCARLALQFAADRAEGVLYDRAVNGYEEVTYNKDGACIAIKKKYCSKSLLEYLKANSAKYQGKVKNQNNSQR